ncbi:glutathione S-transferase family protein [Chelatococcus sp. SYSU_G07232]|uniref:Glutathione S-transferase family protein n=1 Tax=Chelatococcus albus TaxID=3047466 RepID=A0ABT7AIG6_9HYPH|nr:glutathione S-transferase family protein [Chelatococcus sp. SYSU_G07232]MDJ1158875.1 glutathione S-transferase family protein [Chelatococcus sp. SYSU_G07232]
MAAQYHLYGHRRSGHSYKAALALALAGEPFHYTAVDIAEPRAARTAEFREASRYGEVPVLMVDGVPHCQSDAILLRLAESLPALAVPRESSVLAREWLFWEANRIGFSVPNLRFARHWARDTADGVVDWLRRRAEADLERLEAELRRQPFLLGERWSIADIACAAYLFWPEEIDVEWERYPAVTIWLDRLRALPGWRRPEDLMS